MNNEKKEWIAPKVEELVFTQTEGGSMTSLNEQSVFGTAS